MRSFAADMHLVIDIGNTGVKAAVTEGRRMLDFHHGILDSEGFRKFVSDHAGITGGMWCSTRPLTDAETAVIESLPFRMTQFCASVSTPLKNLYSTPLTLGADRLAAAVGAWSENPGHDMLVIDAGTAITYDFVSAAGEYLGGNIAPGKDLRLLSLHEHTGRLPLVSADGPAPETGVSTETAIRSGVLLGIRNEIEGYIQRFSEEHPDSYVFLTGGDAHLFAKTIKKGIFVRDFLVLQGLECIIGSNEDF